MILIMMNTIKILMIDNDVYEHEEDLTRKRKTMNFFSLELLTKS